MTREQWLEHMWKSLQDELNSAYERRARGKGGQQVTPNVYDLMGLGAIKNLQGWCRNALETTETWYNSDTFKEMTKSLEDSKK